MYLRHSITFNYSREWGENYTMHTISTAPFNHGVLESAREYGWNLAHAADDIYLANQ